MSERDAEERAMSDPAEATQANPHPISQHRSPREIALDEAGPIGQPDRDAGAQKQPKPGKRRKRR